MNVLSLTFELDRDEIRGHDAAHAIRGTVELMEDAVVLRYTLRRGTVGGAQVDPHEPVPERVPEALDHDVDVEANVVRIPLSDIESIVMWGGVVRSPRLVIEVTREQALERLPWSDGCSCMVRMRRADGQRTRIWLVEAELRLARVRTGSREL
jgi:hypothetical protein